MQALNIEYRVGHILTKFNLFACCISEEEELELVALSLPLKTEIVKYVIMVL